MGLEIIKRFEIDQVLKFIRSTQGTFLVKSPQNLWSAELTIAPLHSFVKYNTNYKPYWQSASEFDPAADTLLSGQDAHSVAASLLYVLAPHSTHPLSVM